jgi:hypothetical protein
MFPHVVLHPSRTILKVYLLNPVIIETPLKDRPYSKAAHVKGNIFVARIAF